MAALDLDHVSVGSGRTSRLTDVTLSVADGSFVAVVGASGSGKTALLRVVAGLDPLERGRVKFDDSDVSHTPPDKRDVGMVFQSPVLLGHLSARGNVSFPLDVRRLEAQEIRQRVDAEVRALHIEQLMHREPSTLSVSEQQMVQIARALVRMPNVLLLDEPFASLDDQLRSRMRTEIAMLQSGYGVTTLVATNDSADVESLAGMVVVLDDGRLVQVGDPATVRRAPVNLSAAIATGPLSLIDMTVVSDQRGHWLFREDPAGGESVRIRSWAPGLTPHRGTTVTVGVRPEDVDITDTGPISAVVERTARFGTGSISCMVAGARVGVTVPIGSRPGLGSTVRLSVRHHVVFARGDDRRIG